MLGIPSVGIHDPFVEVGGDSLKLKVLKRVGYEMAEHYKRRIHGGTRSSTEAVHRTWVTPTLIRHDPSACLVTPVSIEIGRISLKFRPEGRMIGPFVCFVPFEAPGLAMQAPKA